MTLLATIASIVAYAAPIQVTPGKTVPSIHPIAFAPAPTGTKFVATMEDGSVRIIDGANGRTVRDLGKHPQPAYAVDWSQDGRLIATGDESARVWIENALTGEKMREFRTHQRGVQAISFNVGRNLVISTGRDDAIHVLNLDSDKKKEMLSVLGKGANFYGAHFDPRSGSDFATATLTVGGCRKYDARSGKLEQLLTGHDSQGALTVAFNPAATRIASGGKDSNVALYDAKTNLKIGTLRGHQDWVMAMGFSPNGRLLATGSTDRTVKVWDTKSMSLVATIPNQSFVGSPVCFLADGKTLVTVSDQGYMQYNTISPTQAAVSTPAKAVKKPTTKKKTTRRRKG